MIDSSHVIAMVFPTSQFCCFIYWPHGPDNVAKPNKKYLFVVVVYGHRAFQRSLLQHDAECVLLDRAPVRQVRPQPLQGRRRHQVQQDIQHVQGEQSAKILSLAQQNITVRASYERQTVASGDAVT